MSPSAATPFEFARGMREDRYRFAGLRDARVLFYWPHGLGDWATLGYVVPLLEPSNAYAVMRFGDDYSALFARNVAMPALRSGVLPPGDGGEFGPPHLGLGLRKLRGGPARASVAPPLRAEIEAFAPDTVLWTDYPETEGRTAYPFHTKARNLARLLVRPERLRRFDLSIPLHNAIHFTPPAQVQAMVDEQLEPFAPPGSLICVLSRTGYTAARKNWDVEEARCFVEILLDQAPDWRVISMDEDFTGERVAGFRTLFGSLDVPFAAAYTALLTRTAVFVGVPAGPLHVAMARGGIPTVGLWLAHHPDWYDEPNPLAVHLVGLGVRDRLFDRRAASTTKPASLAHRIEYLTSEDIAAEAVAAFALLVLAGR